MSRCAPSRRSRHPDRQRWRAGRLLPGPPPPRRLPATPAGAGGHPPPAWTRSAADRCAAGGGAAGRRLPRRPGEPGRLPGYARLASHVLATAPLGEHSSAGRRLILDTIGYLGAHGDIHGSQIIGEPLLDRWRSVLGPDHPDTLTAAISLTFVMILAEETGPARALAEDAVQRCRRVLGPDHPTTLWPAATLLLARVQIGMAEA